MEAIHMKILLIDNFDSFTHNLLHLLQGVRPNAKIVVYRNNDSRLLSTESDCCIVSPGPGTPVDTGLLNDLWCQRICTGALPLFGVCLGMQFVASVNNVPLVRSANPVHGRAVAVELAGTHPLTTSLPSRFSAARYNSLETRIGGYADSSCSVLGIEQGSDAVMIMAHRSLPVAGVQFHPESFLSEHGALLLDSFMRLYVETAR